jgi:uncharacterized membrane protein YcaP (DUF421 family)
MVGGDNSLLGGLISTVTLVSLNYLVGLATFKSKRLEALIEGRPLVIIHNGKLYEDFAEKAHLTTHELHSALRQAGCNAVEDVKYAVLENNGAISVVKRETQPPPASDSAQSDA